MTSSKSRVKAGTATRSSARPKIGIALAGGGFLGITYELGALAALSEAVDGLDLTHLDSYVGVSAGAFVASCLANGISVHDMVRMYVEADSGPDSFDPASLLRPDWTSFMHALDRLPTNLAASAGGGFRGLKGGIRSAAWGVIEKGLRSLPLGILDASAAEAQLTRLFNETGRTNDFRKLKTTLRIVATDLDLGEPVEFGAKGFDDVPITRAVSASSAVPGLFRPVRIKSRSYMDGALTKTMHASVALNQGAKLVLCVNPLVPYGASPTGIEERGKAVTSSLASVMRQTVRTAIRSRMTVGLEKYAMTHPQARIILLEPSRADADTFFTNIFSLSSRRRLCEHAYQSTRANLLARFDEIAPAFEPFGYKLNRAILEQPGMMLVRDEQLGDDAWLRDGKLGQSQRELSRVLDDLQRHLKLRNLMS